MIATLALAAAVAAGPADQPVEKIAICHATASAQNPYVLIEVAVEGLNGHGDHEGDIIPAPADGCPEPVEEEPTPEPTPHPDREEPPPEPVPTPPPAGPGDGQPPDPTPDPVRDAFASDCSLSAARG